MKNLLLIVLYLFLSNAFIYSQHNDEHTKLEPYNHFCKLHITMFNGAATNFSHESTSYTISLDYEYRFSKLVGLSLLGVYCSRTEEIVAGIAVFAHPFKEQNLLRRP